MASAGSSHSALTSDNEEAPTGLLHELILGGGLQKSKGGLLSLYPRPKTPRHYGLKGTFLASIELGRGTGNLFEIRSLAFRGLVAWPRNLPEIFLSRNPRVLRCVRDGAILEGNPRDDIW